MTGSAPAGARITIGTSLLAAGSTSTTSDSLCPARTANPGMPSADSRSRSGESEVLMICSRYTFSIMPPATSRPSAPRSRITSTRSGLRIASEVTNATASTRMPMPPTHTRVARHRLIDGGSASM